MSCRQPSGSGPGRSSRSFLGLRDGERRVGILLFAFFFLVIATFWIQKPIRTSRFLAAVGVEYLPLVKLGSALLVLPVVLLYTSMLRRYCRECMVIACVGVFVAGSLAFAFLFSAGGADWVHYAYFFYVDIYATVMVALFWSFASDLVPPPMARRLFGFIGAGGILGGAAGSGLTGWMVGRLGPGSLLLVCAALLVLIAVIAVEAMRSRNLPMPTYSPESPALSLRAAVNGARTTLASPYLQYIVWMIVCYEIVSSIVDYQFSAAASASFDNEIELAAYIGRLGSLTTVLALLVQVVFTTWILRRYGPSVGLLVLPVVLAAGSMAYLAFPLLLVATGLFTSDGGLSYSLNQTSKEVLYTPLDEGTKYQAKAFIDMFLFRISKGISALIIFACNLWLVPLGWKPHHFGLLSLAFIAVWTAAAAAAGRGFSLRAGPRAPVAPRSSPRAAVPAEAIPRPGSLLPGRN